MLPTTNELSSNVIIAHTLKTDTLLIKRQDEINDDLHKFWSHETFGIDPKTPLVSKLDVDPIKDNIEFNEGAGKYEVLLAFKDNHSVIADNYDVAKRHLKCLINRLGNEPETLQEYNNVIQEQLSKGIIEEVSENDIVENTGNTYYSPHREVIRTDRQTTKLRVVYDASSKCKNETSLNEYLDPGPNLVPLIFDILL